MRSQSERKLGRVGLAVAEPDETDLPAPPPPTFKVPLQPWLVGGAIAGASAAVVGWLVMLALATAGWFPDRTGSYADVARFASQLFLAANGGGWHVADVLVTIVPLGLSALFWLLVRLAVTTAYARSVPKDADATKRRVIALQLAASATFAYAVFVSVAAATLGVTAQLWRSVVGSILLAGWAAAMAVGRQARFNLTARWPAPLRFVPKAVFGALLVLAVGSSAAMGTALIAGAQRMSALENGLMLGPNGAFALTVAQLAFLPNLMVWAGSYTLAAGFTVGLGSVVSPTVTNLGLLPAVPITGALPTPGVGEPWQLCWLTAGVLAGALAAIVVVRERSRRLPRPPRFDETALVGGLSGVLAGLAWVGVAAVTRGDLGTERLVGVGPRITELTIIAPTVLGIAGLFVGLGYGLYLTLRGRRSDRELTVAIRPRGGARPVGEGEATVGIDLDTEPLDESLRPRG